MIALADEVDDGSTLLADLVIVGAGPAGLTLADRLRATDLEVIVLESGLDDPDPASQDLAAGDITGEPLRFNGIETPLDMTHLRQFGGTSNHWTGMCRPLDAFDFDTRPAVARSGWPFGLDELRPHYARALTSCELAVDQWDGAWWADQTHHPVLLDDDRVRTAVWQFSPPTRFGPRSRAALSSAPRVRVYQHANVVELVATAAGDRVRSLTVRTLAGRRFTVAADRFVLAAGGIETPRLLLASTTGSPQGLGNGFDQVGRCFMDHPHAIVGRVQLRRPPADWALHLIGEQALPDGTKALVWAGLSPTAAAQDEHGIGNGTAFLWAGVGGPERDRRDADATAAAAAGALAGAGPAGPSAVLSVRIEQEPNPESRVTIGPERDALGMPRASVHWQLTEADWRTLRGTVELVGRGLGVAGLGRVEVDPSGLALERWPIGIGHHHMGTTRMHVDPAQGVVDADGRVHGIDNLYVCGSSVFPTSGMTNPTLTIVALAHRLSEHLGACRVGETLAAKPAPPPISDRVAPRRPVGILVAVFVVGLIHALIYAAVLPAWAIEDEPQHVDYALHLAHDHALPDIDGGIESSIVQSMFDHDRWTAYGMRPPAERSSTAVGLGAKSYLAYHPPLPYLGLAALVSSASGGIDGVALFGLRIVTAIAFGLACAGTALLAARLTAGIGRPARRWSPSVRRGPRSERGSRWRCCR